MRMRAGPQNLRNLVAMGDSQTAARLAVTEAQTYSAVLARRLGIANYTNSGRSGNTTTQMLARHSDDVLAHRPTFVTIMGGPNDLTTNISAGNWVGGGISAATCKSNLKTMAEQALAQRASVVLLTPVPVFSAVYLDNAATYISNILAIGTELSIPVVNVYAAFLALSTEVRNSYLVDDQHPSATGMGFIADLAQSSLA